MEISFSERRALQESFGAPERKIARQNPIREPEPSLSAAAFWPPYDVHSRVIRAPMSDIF